MGIKDKVLDILFDDENDQENASYSNSISHEKTTYRASTLTDTGSVFIDATSPLPKTNPNSKKIVDEPAKHESKPVNESGYKLSENISPIFGIIDSKNKKSKNITKIKNYNDISNKNFDPTSKTQSQAYTSVVISPFYGPMPSKTIKKVSKPRKKANDPFDRDINDTGSFDAIISESEEQETIIDTEEINTEQSIQQESAPKFEEAKEEIVEQTEEIGDTDRLVKISDRINRIKNEAANIYSDEISDNNEPIAEDGHRVETINRGNISDLIHNVQNYDGKVEHNQTNATVTPSIVEEPVESPKEEENVEPISADDQQIDEENETIENSNNQEASDAIETSDNIDCTDSDATNNEQNTEESNENSQVSIDDIFEEEDETEEGKDLFSVLFGDE